MRVAIDGVGRIVIPKPMREQLGIDGPTELELTEHDGRLELSVPYTHAWVEERDGLAVIVTEEPLPPLDQHTVRAVLESVRK
ncbi:MAG TPA: AbrB/MazE/SpoVT family DNA-binding domain-containing protein [Solirubrobacteraceae bacterium]|nr:AbrB/MazE/SpoVT family DNA-binding domain-containing protein [Solirubrobacteraceae bacterium]